VEGVVTEGFQLSGAGPEAYERFLVPAFFAQCAERLLDLAAAAPGERVLDVACGTGVVARGAAARVGPDGAVTGTDLNQEMVSFAEATASTSDLPAPIRWYVADAAELPVPDESFDLACCQQGLQFFDDQPAVVRELHRVLVPGGRVALAVWRPLEQHPVFDSLVDALGRHAGVEAAAMMRGPFSGPGRDALRQLLVDGEFGDVHLTTVVLTVRFASVAAFLEEEEVSTPLAGPVGALAADRRADLDAALEYALAGHVDDQGLVFPMSTWVATARR
jgi:SAM-dependent methyltransferase